MGMERREGWTGSSTTTRTPHPSGRGGHRLSSHGNSLFSASQGWRGTPPFLPQACAHFTTLFFSTWELTPLEPNTTPALKSKKKSHFYYSNRQRALRRLFAEHLIVIPGPWLLHPVLSKVICLQGRSVGQQGSCLPVNVIKGSQNK